MKYEPEKIEGIYSKSYAELNDDLLRILKKAEADAEALQAEISDAYDKRDKAEKEMKKAAGVRDMNAYKEARLEYDMQNEFIEQSEPVFDILNNGPLLSKEVRGAIRERIAKDQYHATGAAALKIEKLMEEIKKVRDELQAQINEMNSVIVQLNMTARTKHDNGELYFYKGTVSDSIVDPYVKELDPLISDSMKRASFKIFAENYKGIKN